MGSTASAGGQSHRGGNSRTLHRCS